MNADRLKIVIGTNEGKVLCISNNEDEIKASMVNYLIDTDQEPTEDFFESRNWGEYDIEVYEYLQPQLTDDQQEVLEWLQIYADKDSGDKPFQTIFFLWDCIKSNNLGNVELSALRKLTRAEQFQVLAAFAEWGLKEDNQ